MARKRRQPNNGASLGFEEKLWLAADKLRGHMDAAEYKHIVLGLIFLKYVSDAFTSQRDALRARLSEPNDEYFVDDAAQLERELEERDYYTAENVFWVSEAARWDNLHERARQPGIGGCGRFGLTMARCHGIETRGPGVL